ncbi:MAG: MarR family transcriptional regulator [Candidatus Omnitrophica bacterium]|nr:MarR family transcriptional regulator [Candidatus Omnitrophota bacterium]
MSAIPLTEFAERLNHILPLITKEFFKRQTNKLFKGKLTVPQFLVLDCLLREGNSKMSTLAQVLDVTTAAMTGIVDRLVRDGYLKRSFDSGDRRVIKITLTPRGTAIVKKIIEERQQLIMKIFGEISEDDRAEYLRILMQIRDILNQE